uniref:Uncharacterized protein n=1 Tax=Picocystis salinarum TaxID=88271 RepID=A0A7S3XH22_9CHLO|mmetsp:Transcript_4607/g.29194  ORF Transcript_4607/g.29194 Transcript_4607/m.29194 type:complete len:839 (+) Transcript_4607:245-2761(+)
MHGEKATDKEGNQDAYAHKLTPQTVRRLSMDEMELDELLLQAKEVCELAETVEEEREQEDRLLGKTPASTRQFLELISDVWKNEKSIEGSKLQNEKRSIEGTKAVLQTEDLEGIQKDQHLKSAPTQLPQSKGITLLQQSGQMLRGKKIFEAVSTFKDRSGKYATKSSLARAGEEVSSRATQPTKKENFVPQKLQSLINDVEKSIKSSIAGKTRWGDVAVVRNGVEAHSQNACVSEKFPTPARQLDNQAVPLKLTDKDEDAGALREDLTNTSSSRKNQVDTRKMEMHSKFSLSFFQSRGSLASNQRLSCIRSPAGDLSDYLTKQIVDKTRPGKFGCTGLSFEGLLEEDLQAQELSELSTVNLDGNAIGHLKKVELLARMQNLSVAHNHMTAITNLHKLKWLIRLDLGWNNLTSLPSLDQLDGLEWVSLEHNRLSNISGLRKCFSLKLLILRGNMVSDLSDLPINSSMVFLDIGFNPITNFMGLDQRCPHLAYLLAGHCRLCLPTLLALPNLKALDIRSNHISSLSWLHALQSLEVLDLSHNSVTDIGDVKDFIIGHEQCKMNLHGNLLEKDTMETLGSVLWQGTDANTKLKELIREYPVFRRVDQCRLVQCVIVIQSHWRRILAYRRVLKIRKRRRRCSVTQAAIRIQSWWRGHRSRRGCADLKAVRQQEELHLHHAALRIQSAWRGHRCRNRIRASFTEFVRVLNDTGHDGVDLASEDWTVDLQRFLRPVRVPARSNFSKTSGKARNANSNRTTSEGSSIPQQAFCQDLPAPCVSSWGIANPKTAALLLRSQHRKLLGERSKAIRSKLQDPLVRLERFHARQSRHRTSDRPSPSTVPP